MTEKIKQAKANTLVRVNNVIYAKISDSENSKWRSAFGEIYANAFINKVLQAKDVEFLSKEPLKRNRTEKKDADSVEEKQERRTFLAERYDVREEESNEHQD